ncbi:MAG: hypothetical protein FJ303_21850 [Planctomycetes bacterium]|nr:hypothetical protein [Planctomycetota bacterium]
MCRFGAVFAVDRNVVGDVDGVKRDRLHAMRFSWGANTPELFRSATIFGMVADIATVPAALLAIAVVIAIDARQDERGKAASGMGRSGMADC